MEKQRDQQAHVESKTRLVERINACLRSGDYPRALDLLRGAAAALSNDAELSELEKRAQDGVKRTTEANRLITESQELFAQQKSTEAIQLLRKAYELDRNNSLARSILANALVEHAHSFVETDWLEAETLAKQALDLNPAHPTAKTILTLVLDWKKTSSVEDWVSQARKLQSSGDLFKALAWVAEGLAVHPEDPKLLQIQDAIQRDQGARRRQTRRRDLEDLRRMEREIDGAPDAAAKQALAERIQAMAARYWTDGEMLSIANGLLHRLGLVSEQSKGGPVIFHVPRTGAAKPLRTGTSPSQPSETKASTVLPESIPTTAPPGKVLPKVVPPDKVATTLPEPLLPAPQPVSVPAAVPAAPPNQVAPQSSHSKRAARSNSLAPILVGAAAIILVAAASLFFARKSHVPAGKTPAADTHAPAISTPAAPAPPISAPILSSPAETNPEPPLPAPALSSNAVSEKVAPDDSGAAGSGHDRGTLLILAGQDNAKVFLNGKLQRQLTQAGQLRLSDLELKEYVVQVSKSGFQDPPQQKIRIRKGEEAQLTFNLQPRSQPQPHLASLTIQGGTPGTSVLVDQNLVGAIQPDGTLSASNLNPGDHTVELRKEGFRPRQFKKHFADGGAISLSAADATLEVAPGDLKIIFTPSDAKVAVVKGDLLTMVSSGVPLNLAAGTYTLTARTADRFTRSSTLEVVAGQSKTVDLSLAPNGMSKWDDPNAWKHEGDSFTRKGGDFVLYGVAPPSGTFIFSAMLTKGRLLQWVLNYRDPKNYVLFQMDENNFYRSVIRNGEKRDQVIVPHKADKKSFRTLLIRVSPTELVHQIRDGDSSTMLDRWTQPGANLSQGKFGFYIPGNEQVALSSFAHYPDLNIH